MEEKSKFPRIFIIGPTCSGKTALSLHLSNNFPYEIINCDSMQFYKGADIMTAKATQQEQFQTPHHLLNILSLNEKSEQKIELIEGMNKGIMAVGGTNYYVESLLFDIDVREWGVEELSWEQIIKSLKQKETITPIEALQIIDPEMAKQFHPNDTRRIITCLKIYLSTGKLPSEYQKENQIGKMRKHNSIIFWL